MTDMCVRCENFSTKNHPEHARAGLGRCLDRTEMIVFVPWSGQPACKARKPAKSMALRNNYIEKQLQREASMEPK